MQENRLPDGPYEPSWKERQSEASAKEWAKIYQISPQNQPLVKFVVELAHYANELSKVVFDA